MLNATHSQHDWDERGVFKTQSLERFRNPETSQEPSMSSILGSWQTKQAYERYICEPLVDSRFLNSSSLQTPAAIKITKSVTGMSATWRAIIRSWTSLRSSQINTPKTMEFSLIVHTRLALLILYNLDSCPWSCLSSKIPDDVCQLWSYSKGIAMWTPLTHLQWQQSNCLRKNIVVESLR